MPLLGVTSIIIAGINFMCHCQPDRWNICREDRTRRHKCYFSNFPHRHIWYYTATVTVISK